PPEQLVFNAAGRSITGNAADLGGIQIGDVITPSGTASNNNSYVVTGTTPNRLTNEVSTAAVVNDTTAAVTTNATAGNATVFFHNSGVILATGANSMSGMNVGDSLTVTLSASNNTARTVSETFSNAIVQEANNPTATLTDGTTSFAGSATGGLTFSSANNTIS